MERTLLLSAAVGFVGLTLLLSEVRWIRRPGLADRLSPYAPSPSRSSALGVFSVASFREVVAPLAEVAGQRIARIFGVTEELGTRLRRVHSPLDVATFRVRQAGVSGAAMLGGALVAAALQIPAGVAILFVLGAPVLAFLLLEQQLATASAAWQRQLFLELPVVAEQLGMLTTAGWSLGSALQRVSSRGSGRCAADLQRATQRIRQGVSEAEALGEWAELAQVDALDRLISILSMNRETADLGRLISEEARSIRRDAQRELIESIERRNQQVWIPVTVAALIPGVLLMGVPFIDALTLFSSS